VTIPFASSGRIPLPDDPTNPLKETSVFPNSVPPRLRVEVFPFAPEPRARQTSRASSTTHASTIASIISRPASALAVALLRAPPMWQYQGARSSSRA
jgi:hypothetical protein